jgi:serine/threonine-protein kinase PpkA
VALIQAGAAAVMRKDRISANHLYAAITQGGLPPPVAETDKASLFAFMRDGEREAVVIPDYRALSSIAANPMAQVFFAEQLLDGHRAVVKLLTVAPYHELQRLQDFCFLYEFLSIHGGRNTVRYLDAGITGVWPYVVLEYLPCGDLRRRINSGIAPAEATRMLFQLAGALALVHEGCLAHMDIKPENIFFRDDGSLVLIDFNIATRFGEVARNPLTGDVLGTPFYMSPEQGQGLPVDGRSDMYSAGVVFFEMLAGEPPYRGESAAQILFRHIHDEIPLLPRSVRQFQPIIDKLLAKNPGERLQTGADLAFALGPLLSPALGNPQ